MALRPAQSGEWKTKSILEKQVDPGYLKFKSDFLNYYAKLFCAEETFHRFISHSAVKEYFSVSFGRVHFKDFDGNSAVQYPLEALVPAVPRLQLHIKMALSNDKYRMLGNYFVKVPRYE